MQSAFHPQSPDAAAIGDLMMALFVGGAIIFIVVMGLVAIAMRRHPSWLAGDRTILVGGVALPLVVLLALLLYSLSLAGARDTSPPALRIEVTGHQWWWQVRYVTADGQTDFETANEIRLPVGERVEIALRSADVLHSFWVPNLAGKLDMVPGRTTRMRMSATEPGVYRGQCAEYCGGVHAQMALYVVAEPAAAFDAWADRQRRPAEQANALFLARCAVCHAVRGTPARGTLGPDLTHVGSRVSLGAGILPNNTGTMAAWIASNQHIKPGNLMPQFEALGAVQLRELADYLAGLH